MKLQNNISARLRTAFVSFFLLSVSCIYAAEGIFVAQWGYLRVPASDKAARTKVIDTARQLIEEHGWTLKGEKGSEIPPELAKVSISFEAADSKRAEIEFLTDDMEVVRVRVFADPKLARLVTTELGTRLKLKSMEAK
jgi:hypothetical protein